MSAIVTEPSTADLDAFVADEYPGVVAAVGIITGNHGDAADAVQDALVGFLARPPAHPVPDLAVWVTVVASNRVRDADGSRSADERGPGHDVMNAFDRLPLRQRQVCTLHYLLDRSVETIATGLGVTAATVKTQLRRARRALATQVRRESHHG